MPTSPGPKLPRTVAELHAACVSTSPKFEVKKDGFTQHTDGPRIIHGFPSLKFRVTVTDPAPRDELGFTTVTFKVLVAELNGIDLGVYLLGITEEKQPSPQTGWKYTLTFPNFSPSVIHSVERAKVTVEERP